MALWRAKAIKLMPELSKELAAAKNIMAAWIEIHLAFERACKRSPRDESLIARVYSFADWCVNAPRNSDPGRDPFTAVAVCFFEEIPTLPIARDDMPRWFRFDEIAHAKEIFGYHLDAKEYQQLLAHMQKNRHRYIEREGSVAWI